MRSPLHLAKSCVGKSWRGNGLSKLLKLVKQQEMARGMRKIEREVKCVEK